jgi:deazaflavin-dependent oxidoreductase (nitroreductase family)
VARLLTASLALAGLSWLVWFVAPAAAAPGPLWWSALLALNVAITLASLNLKRRIVCLLQRWVVNPPVRLLLAMGVVPLGWALIETTGRKTGKARRTPVGNGLVGNTFWIVAEHGRDAGYVRNLARNPRVRIKARRGIRTVWTAGTADVLDDDDPYARQRTLARWHPLRALNAAIVRVMGTDLLTIRIDLDK